MSGIAKRKRAAGVGEFISRRRALRKNLGFVLLERDIALISVEKL